MILFLSKLQVDRTRDGVLDARERISHRWCGKAALSYTHLPHSRNESVGAGQALAAFAFPRWMHVLSNEATQGLPAESLARGPTSEYAARER